MRLTIQNAFRRIRMPRAFARSLCLSACSVKIALRDSRTDSPSIHRRSRQRIEASFRLGRAARACLAARVRPRRWMRPNRLLPPYTRLRAPAPRELPAQSQGCLFPALTWGTWRFTTPRPLRRAYRLSSMGGVVFPIHEPICRASDIPVAFPQARCGSLSAPTLRNCRGLRRPRVRDDHTISTTPRCLPSMGNRSLGFPLRPLAVTATSPSRFGGTTLFRSPRFRRHFRAAVWPRFARPPATQTPPAFWEGNRLRFSGPQRHPSTSATHFDARAHTTNSSSSPVNGFLRPFAFAVAMP